MVRKWTMPVLERSASFNLWGKELKLVTDQSTSIYFSSRMQHSTERADIPLWVCSNIEHLCLTDHGDVAPLSCLFQRNGMKDKMAADRLDACASFPYRLQILLQRQGRAESWATSWMTLSMTALDLWIPWRCTDFLDMVPGKLKHVYSVVWPTVVYLWKVDFLDDIHMRGILRRARWNQWSDVRWYEQRKEARSKTLPAHLCYMAGSDLLNGWRVRPSAY